MSTFKININNPKDYLAAIAGVTTLTPKESTVLGEIVSYMHSRNLTVLDDDVKNHIMQVASYKNKQGYYNLIHTLKKKKLLVHSRKKMQLRPILAKGTVLQITFAAPEPLTELKQYEESSQA